MQTHFAVSSVESANMKHCNKAVDRKALVELDLVSLSEAVGQASVALGRNVRISRCTNVSIERGVRIQGMA